jgi:hypothetical protein
MESNWQRISIYWKFLFCQKFTYAVRLYRQSEEKLEEKIGWEIISAG